MADISLQDAYGGQVPAAQPTAQSPAVISLNDAYAGVNPAQPVAPTGPAPQSTLERMHQAMAANGYQPNAVGEWISKNVSEPISGFSEQAQRAASMGLTDKVSAGAAALNAMVKKGYDAVTGATSSAPSASPGTAYQDELAASRAQGNAYSQEHPIASPIATTLGTIGAAGSGGFVGEGTAAGAPTLVGRVMQGVKGGATIGAIGGFGGSDDKSIGSDLLATGEGGATGAAIGGVLPLVGAQASKLLGSVDAETGKLADLAKNTYNIPLTGAEITNNPVVKYSYSQLKKIPFSGAGNEVAVQQGAFNKAVAGTFGEDAAKITPEVLQQARDRIGGVFNGVAQRTDIPMTNDFMTKLQGVVDNARMTSSADSVAPIERQAMNVVNTAANNGGSIGGKAYIDLTAKGGPIDAMMQSGDSGIRQAGIQLRGALDDALQQHAAPEDLTALKTARTQYKALKTVEPLTLRADTIGGATPSTGDISPAALRGAVNQSYANVARANPGDVPLNDLAKIGQRFLKEPPDSGTATREMVNHGLGTAGAIAAGLGAHAAGVPLSYAAGGLAAGRVGSSLLRNPAYADNLVNRALGRQPVVNPLARSALPIMATPSIPLSSMFGLNSQQQ